MYVGVRIYNLSEKNHGLYIIEICSPLPWRRLLETFVIYEVTHQEDGAVWIVYLLLDYFSSLVD